MQKKQKSQLIYFDLEVLSRSEKLDLRKSEILTIQYQTINWMTGKPSGSLHILKSWESSEEQIIKEFFKAIKIDNLWAFIPIGFNIVQFDFLVLYYRARKYKIKLDPLFLLQEKPFIDIKPMILFLNNLRFKGSGIDNFTAKSSSGKMVRDLYLQKKYSEIEQYIIEETNAILDLIQWLIKYLPNEYRKSYLPKIKKLKEEKKKENEHRKIISTSEVIYNSNERRCPKCGSVALEKFDELREGMGSDGMTEGEYAEYLAGTWGTLICMDCGYSFDYEE